MCLSVNCQPGKLLMNFLCSLPWLLGPNMLYLSRVSQCSLGPSPSHGLQFLLLRSGGLLLHLIRRGGLLLRSGGLLLGCGGLLPRRGDLLGGSCSVCSALVDSCSVCATLVDSCSVCATLVGSCSDCSAPVGSCSDGPVLVSGSALAPCSVSFTLVSCSALVLCPVGSASVPSLTSTWTWPSVSSPGSASVPPPSWIVMSLAHLEAAPSGL